MNADPVQQIDNANETIIVQQENAAVETGPIRREDDAMEIELRQEDVKSEVKLEDNAQPEPQIQLHPETPRAPTPEAIRITSPAPDLSSHVDEADIFAPDADLTVTVGSDDEMRSFRVHGTIVSLASPQWRSLVSALPTKAVLFLPDDDPEAFYTTMMVAYYRLDDIDDSSIDQDLFFAIMQLYCKYSLQRLLKRQIEEWMQKWDFESIELELKVYWLLKDKDSFEESWKKAVLHCVTNMEGEYEYRSVKRVTEAGEKCRKGVDSVEVQEEKLPSIILGKHINEIQIRDKTNHEHRAAHHRPQEQAQRSVRHPAEDPNTPLGQVHLPQPDLSAERLHPRILDGT